MKTPNNKKHFETIAVREQMARTLHKEHSTPLFLTSSFIFDDSEEARALFAEEKEGNIYSRYSNPNNDEFVSKMCRLEKVEDGISTASGMSAMFLSLIAFTKSGDHILSSRSLFGSTHQILTRILPKWGINHTYVDINTPKLWEEAVRPNTKVLFLETPSNPGLDIVDLKWAGELARAHNLILIVDNCFATPYLQTPATLGAHVVTHSATKFIDGQGRVLGGVILGSTKLMEEVRFLGKHTGPSLSAFNAWILSRSLETLAVRLDRHCENAETIARQLLDNPEIQWVKYPFLENNPQKEIAKKQMHLGGGLLTFELKGGLPRCVRFVDHLKMLSRSPNLGDTRSIVTHPAYTTHSKLSPEERQSVGITDGLIRISAGLEHIDDIYGDIEQAIHNSKN